jgi:protein phosphatase
VTSQTLEFAGRTDVGKVRKNNEDNFAIDEALGLIVVADGMGGHNSGEEASRLAVETIVKLAHAPGTGQGSDGKLSPRARQLESCIKAANELIYEKGRAVPKDAGMGTTVVAAFVEDRKLIVAHVGDSRLYLYRKGQLQQLTDDHSLVGDQIKRGLITAEEASKSALQNILTRAVGAEPDVKVDVAEHALSPGDVVLLATDGLTKMMSDEDVARLIAKDSTPAVVVSNLVELSCAAGGVDNVTVAAARITDPAAEAVAGLKSLMNKFFGK